MMVIGALVATRVYANCLFPPPPTHLPDGTTATLHEMQSAFKVMNDYKSGVEAYVSCVKMEPKSTGTCNDLTGCSTAPTQQVATRWISAAIDQLRRTASQFNTQVRIFKARGTQRSIPAGPSQSQVETGARNEGSSEGAAEGSTEASTSGPAIVFIEQTNLVYGTDPSSDSHYLHRVIGRTVAEAQRQAQAWVDMQKAELASEKAAYGPSVNGKAWRILTNFRCVGPGWWAVFQGGQPSAVEGAQYGYWANCGRALTPLLRKVIGRALSDKPGQREFAVKMQNGVMVEYGYLGPNTPIRHQIEGQTPGNPPRELTINTVPTCVWRMGYETVESNQAEPELEAYSAYDDVGTDESVSIGRLFNDDIFDGEAAQLCGRNSPNQIWAMFQ